MGKTLECLVALALATAVALPCLAVEPAAKEDFNKRAPTDNWKPNKGKDGWTVSTKAPNRVILDAKHGRNDSVGMAASRTDGNASSTTPSWHTSLDQDVNTLGFCVMLPQTDSGMDVITSDGKYLGYVRIGHSVGIALSKTPTKGGWTSVLPGKDLKTGQWYHVELQHDFAAGKQRLRVDDGDWSQWLPLMTENKNKATFVLFYFGVTKSGDVSACIDDVSTYHLDIEDEDSAE